MKSKKVTVQIEPWCELPVKITLPLKEFGSMKVDFDEKLEDATKELPSPSECPTDKKNLIELFPLRNKGIRQLEMAVISAPVKIVNDWGNLKILTDDFDLIKYIIKQDNWELERFPNTLQFYSLIISKINKGWKMAGIAELCSFANQTTPEDWPTWTILSLQDVYGSWCPAISRHHGQKRIHTKCYGQFLRDFSILIIRDE